MTHRKRAKRFFDTLDPKWLEHSFIYPQETNITGNSFIYRPKTREIQRGWILEAHPFGLDGI